MVLRFAAFPDIHFQVFFSKSVLGDKACYFPPVGSGINSILSPSFREASPIVISGFSILLSLVASTCLSFSLSVSFKTSISEDIVNSFSTATTSSFPVVVWLTIMLNSAILSPLIISLQNYYNVSRHVFNVVLVGESSVLSEGKRKPRVLETRDSGDLDTKAPVQEHKPRVLEEREGEDYSLLISSRDSYEKEANSFVSRKVEDAERDAFPVEVSEGKPKEISDARELARRIYLEKKEKSFFSRLKSRLGF